MLDRMICKMAIPKNQGVKELKPFETLLFNKQVRTSNRTPSCQYGPQSSPSGLVSIIHKNPVVENNYDEEYRSPVLWEIVIFWNILQQILNNGDGYLSFWFKSPSPRAWMDYIYISAFVW